MDCDKFLDEDEILYDEILDEPGDVEAIKKRERLAGLAVGGQAKQYLGRNVTADEIDSMTNEEFAKLYARYESRLGAAMTKTLGTAALHLYSAAASMFLPIPPENQPKLAADLEADPFVGHALSTATCELYHRYGMFLAPLTAALTTFKHCQFGHKYSSNIPEDVRSADRDPTRESYSEDKGP